MVEINCGLKLEKQLSMEHITQRRRTERSAPINGIKSCSFLRIKNKEKTMNEAVE
jgi:hypothetical protein